MNTGRKPEDPPLQNIPLRTETGKALRDAFKPDGPIAPVDYLDIELRILASMLTDTHRPGA